MLQAWVRLPQQKHFLFKGVLAGSIETDKMKSCYLAIPKMMKKIFPCHPCSFELGLFYSHILRARISSMNVFSVKILPPGIQTGNFGLKISEGFFSGGNGSRTGSWSKFKFLIVFWNFSVTMCKIFSSRELLLLSGRIIAKIDLLNALCLELAVSQHSFHVWKVKIPL